MIAIQRASGSNEVYVAESALGQAAVLSTTDTSGAFRIARVGDTFYAYYLANDEWQLLRSAVLPGAGDVSFLITSGSADAAFSNQPVRVAFDDVEVVGEPVGAQCGDGIQSVDEECDDGNTDAGDGCSSTCLLEVCGNGRIDFGEGCDDGDLVDGDGCDYNCTVTGCGNGVVAGDEVCDDGNDVSGDGCDANCTPTACGNDVVTEGEECDDGNTDSGDGCASSCLLEGCGNGRLDVGEGCEDGNTTSGDGCDENCTPTGCGNGILTGGEVCDDGNPVEDDGCDASCHENWGEQTRTQTSCIVGVNKGIERVVRAQAKAGESCLQDAAKGRLGSAPGAFDACLATDRSGRVAKAQQDLQATEQKECSESEPPELALGEDRLSGSGAARALPVQLVRDLLGDPATASPKSEREAARCQSRILKDANKLFDEVWREILSAKTEALGGNGMDAAVNDQELSVHLEQSLGSSERLGKTTEKLRRDAAKTCGGVDTFEVFPGCQSADVVACADRAARCRACQLLQSADPLLSIDCDEFDDATANLSCSD